MAENKRSLVVILGAGASHDCFVRDFAEIEPDENYKPPLTKDLFNSHPAFHDILTKYPFAPAAASEFIRLWKNDKEVTVEDFLKDLQSLNDEEHRKQFHFVKLYLQDLLATISKQYLGSEKRSTAYTSLLEQIDRHRLSGRFDTVCLITLNYDLFLDNALKSNFNIELSHIDRYVTFKPNWSYIKFHGSVNWARQVIHAQKIPYTREGTWGQKLIREITQDSHIEERLKQEINIFDPLGVTETNTNTRFYPVIAAPVKGKYEPICPKSHMDCLESALAAPEVAVLVIGFSAQDKDLTDVLKKYWANWKWMNIVNLTSQSGALVIQNLSKEGFNLHGYSFKHDCVKEIGFRDYVLHQKGLHTFLRAIPPLAE